jgi:ABC-type bacteriocin/lantibiotic exporter with double-glycine peptidase domain
MNQYVLMILFKVLIAAGLLIAGSILVIQQQMNIGQFVAAEIIILLVLSSVEKLVLSLETIYDVLTSLEKVGQVTDLSLELDQGTQKLDIDCDTGMKVELTKVSFSYPEQERSILDNVSMTIQSGESVLVFGGNDSGKTTLLYVMAGLYKLQKGSVSYNEIPYGNYNPNQLRSHIGEFLNDESLFEGSIMENITMGRERATFENVKWAIEKVGLTNFIKTLPYGYETMVLAQGKQFSKGVVTKIILARSIADKPKLLLIEDRFSALEPKERDEIFDFLTQKDQPWTLVVSTKEMRLAEKVDRVFEINNGTITELER